MRLYLATMYTNNISDRANRLYTEVLNDHERACVDATRYILESYHYVYSDRKVEAMRRDGAKVFLDSGAFSAFALGVEIDMQAYCRYIHANADIIEVASVLDGIGDPLKTFQNQWTMERIGTRPLPCFHFGEDERYLEWYVDNYQYITLGGMVPHSTRENQLWLDRIWSRYLCDSEGRPKLKVHGFGMTSLPLMKRYPWYSVDSSSWMQIGSMGNVYVPKWGTISVSDKSPRRKEANGHVETLSSMQRDAIVAEIEQRGFSYERLHTLYPVRWAFNISIYNEICLELETKELRFQAEQTTLF